MARKARKDRAKSNTTALANLHIGSLVVNVLFLAFYFVFRSRSILAWGLLSIPAFFCQLTLERTGRPSYDSDTKALEVSRRGSRCPGSHRVHVGRHLGHVGCHDSGHPGRQLGMASLDRRPGVRRLQGLRTDGCSQCGWLGWAAWMPARERERRSPQRTGSRDELLRSNATEDFADRPVPGCISWMEEQEASSTEESRIRITKE